MRPKVLRVCLKYGKCEPRPRLSCDITSLKNFTGNQNIGEPLDRGEASGMYPGWRFTDGLNWKEPGRRQIFHADG